MNLVIFLLVAISLLSITTLTSYALFTNEAEGANSINLTVSTAGKVSIRIYAQDTGTEVGTLNSHQNIIKFNVKDGYIMDSFSCTTGEAPYNKVSNILTINNATKNGSCEIDYVEGYRRLYDAILSEPLVAKDGLMVTNQSKIYYYQGNVTNNYVSLPEKQGSNISNALYRIMRINEDSSIRLIRQDGLNNNTGYEFNSTYNDYKYMYYSESNIEGGIMNRINNWYDATFKGTEIENNIVDSIFCQEAKLTWFYNSGSSLIAGSQSMSPASDNYIANFNCCTDANNKNKLILKAGLISIDEAVLAGYPLYTKTAKENTNVYLHNVYNFWTISPAGFFNGLNAFAWAVSGSGNITTNSVNTTYVIRPVISLNNKVLVEGKGTKTEPWIIKNTK